MIFDYIEAFYNPVRRHSSLGLRSPATFSWLQCTSVVGRMKGCPDAMW